MTVGITTDAVIFFDNNLLVKEMLYPEFEAILDNVVGLNEFAGRKISAAYVRINTGLKITSAVLFTIDFDARGYVDRSWNLPLQHLADNAGKGPDLGAGPIKLSCRSQCSVSWHQRSLWDPNLVSGTATFDQLVHAAKRNRLGLTPFDEAGKEDPEPPLLTINQHGQSSANEAVEKKLKEQLSKKFQQELKKRLSALKEEHSLRIASLRTEVQDHVDKLRSQYRNELTRITNTLNSTKQLFSEEKHKNLQLKKTLESQLDKFRSDREGLQKKIEEGKEVEQIQLLALEEKFEQESKAKIDKVTAELKEMLDMREVELFYRDEQVSRLNEELTLLRQEKHSLVESSADHLIQKLVETGISFVSYQPGVDQLTIPARDISLYLESPINYIAEKCSVDPLIYNQWLAHYELPVCNHQQENGSLCGNPIAKVGKPADFVAGESDRCVRHERSANVLSQLMKVREPS